MLEKDFLLHVGEFLGTFLDFRLVKELHRVAAVWPEASFDISINFAFAFMKGLHDFLVTRILERRHEPSVTPAVFVEDDGGPGQGTWRGLCIAGIALETRHASATALAGVGAFPWNALMVFANPATVFAVETFHLRASSIMACQMISASVIRIGIGLTCS